MHATWSSSSASMIADERTGVGERHCLSRSSASDACEERPGSSSSTAAAMDHPGDIGETLVLDARDSVSSARSAAAWRRNSDTDSHLTAPLAGLLIKFGIKPKASHISIVSHLYSLVIQIGHGRSPIRRQVPRLLLRTSRTGAHPLGSLFPLQTPSRLQLHN